MTLVIRLQHSETLFALVAIPILVALLWLLLRWKKQAVIRIGDPALVKQLISNYSHKAFLIKAILGITALFIIIVASANLQKPGAMDPVERKGVDVMIALDVSKSMLAEDIAPNRIERARQFVQQLIKEIPEDRIGLILFAGRAYLQMPLTTDHSSAQMFVQNASPEAVPSQGTVISEALRLSNAAFNSKERKYKAVVLITDGEDHDPQTQQLAEELSANGIMINTIGIGSPTGTVIPEPGTNNVKKDELGNTVISRLNEPALQQLASTTNGIYVRLNDPSEAVKAVSAKLSTIEGSVIEDQAFRDYKSYFQWFLAAGLLLLVVEFFLPERKFKFR